MNPHEWERRVNVILLACAASLVAIVLLANWLARQPCPCPRATWRLA